MKYIAIFAVLVFSSIFGENPQEIRVQLKTESTLAPIYLSSIELINTPLSNSYAKELEKVLSYDFRYNGKTVTVEKSAEKDKLVKLRQIKEISCPYAVSFTIQGKELSATVISSKATSAKIYSNIQLTGSLAEDRRKIHQLSDQIFKELFHAEGIARSRLLYSYQKKDETGQWISEIVECDWDGENMTFLTKEGSYCINPIPIPKGEHFQKDCFLYVSYKAGQPKIFIASKEDGKGKRVVDIRGNQMLPTISRQRDKIAFICDASGRTDLFVQSLSPETGKTSTPKQIFSYPRSSQGSPTFSPDGSKIAFVSDKDGSPRIYIIPSEAKKTRATAQLLTKKNKENTCPCWSPDGTKLAYSAKTEGTRQIWIYDFETHEERQLTTGPGNKENPSWAPNSLHLVFNSTDDMYSDLYIVNIYQPDAVKITKGPGKKHYPAWGSR